VPSATEKTSLTSAHIKKNPAFSYMRCFKITRTHCEFSAGSDQQKLSSRLVFFKRGATLMQPKYILSLTSNRAIVMLVRIGPQQAEPHHEKVQPGFF
jgi:hypothetical protein